MKIDKHKLSIVVNKLIQENKKLGGAVMTEEIKSLWSQLMTEDVVLHTRKIIFKKGVLTVKLDSAPLRQNLIFRSETIMSDLNKLITHDIKIRQIQFK